MFAGGPVAVLALNVRQVGDVRIVAHHGRPIVAVQCRRECPTLCRRDRVESAVRQTRRVGIVTHRMALFARRAVVAAQHAVNPSCKHARMFRRFPERHLGRCAPAGAMAKNAGRLIAHIRSRVEGQRHVGRAVGQRADRRRDDVGQACRIRVRPEHRAPGHLIHQLVRRLKQTHVRRERIGRYRRSRYNRLLRDRKTHVRDGRGGKRQVDIHLQIHRRADAHRIQPGGSLGARRKPVLGDVPRRDWSRDQPRVQRRRRRLRRQGRGHRQKHSSHAQGCLRLV